MFESLNIFEILDETEKPQIEWLVHKIFALSRQQKHKNGIKNFTLEFPTIFGVLPTIRAAVLPNIESGLMIIEPSSLFDSVSIGRSYYLLNRSYKKYMSCHETLLIGSDSPMPNDKFSILTSFFYRSKTLTIIRIGRDIESCLTSLAEGAVHTLVLLNKNPIAEEVLQAIKSTLEINRLNICLLSINLK